MADVLTFGGEELRQLSVARRWFSITGGWRDGLEVRGVDWTIVGAPGMYELNRVAKLRKIMVVGFVLATSETNWDAEMADLEGIFDPTLGSQDLVVTTPYMGLATGVRRISARVANYLTVDVVPQLVTRWDVTLHCVTNPPDWADEVS